MKASGQDKVVMMEGDGRDKVDKDNKVDMVEGSGQDKVHMVREGSKVVLIWGSGLDKVERDNKVDMMEGSGEDKVEVDKVEERMDRYAYFYEHVCLPYQPTNIPTYLMYHFSSQTFIEINLYSHRFVGNL